MKRRQFITLLGGAAAAWPLAARAQQGGRVIGFFGVSTPSTDELRVAAFVQRLRELGWIEGRTVAIEYRWAEGRTGRFAEIAAELSLSLAAQWRRGRSRRAHSRASLARLKVDVIVTAGAAPVFAAKQATSLIPIVFAIATDPVGTGIVASLARPGGNATGLSRSEEHT